MKKAVIFITIAVLFIVPIVIAETDLNARTPLPGKETVAPAMRQAGQQDIGRNDSGSIFNDLNVADIHTDETSNIEYLFKDVHQGEQAVLWNEREYEQKESTNPIPEPLTMMLFGFGLLTLGWIIRRHNHFSDR